MFWFWDDMEEISQVLKPLENLWYIAVSGVIGSPSLLLLIFKEI